MTAVAACPHLVAFDSELREDDKLTRERMRRFVAERALPYVGDWFEQGHLPTEIVSELAELGVFGMSIAGHGCVGARSLAYGLACLELEAGDSGLRSFASVQSSRCMPAIHRWGSEEQREHYRPSMANGDLIGFFCLTEPDASVGGPCPADFDMLERIGALDGVQEFAGRKPTEAWQEGE